MMFRLSIKVDAVKISAEVWLQRITMNQSGDSCWMGCAIRCSHGVDNFMLSTGPCLLYFPYFLFFVPKLLGLL